MTDRSLLVCARCGIQITYNDAAWIDDEPYCHLDEYSCYMDEQQEMIRVPPSIARSLAKGVEISPLVESLFFGDFNSLDKQAERDENFLGVAEAMSRMSTCSRRQVGAVIVDEKKHIVGSGYNGAPSGFTHCVDGGCPRGRLNSVEAGSEYNVPGSPGFCVAIHAEANALAHSVGDVAGATVYVTHEPCADCTRQMAAAKIVRAVWPEGSMDPAQELREMAGVN